MWTRVIGAFFVVLIGGLGIVSLTAPIIIDGVEISNVIKTGMTIVACFLVALIAAALDITDAPVFVIQHVGSYDEPVVAVRKTREAAEQYGIDYLRHYFGQEQAMKIAPDGAITCSNGDQLNDLDDNDLHPDLDAEVTDLVCVYITEKRLP